MIRIFVFLVLISTICLVINDGSIHTAVSDSTSRRDINPIIGEQAFFETFGRLPDAQDSEYLRIQTHLRYVLRRLVTQTPSNLGREQLAERDKNLRNLERYIEDGQFPSNYDYPGARKPCFIDQNGNICAVGYLVEQSAGRTAAEMINARFQYATIQEMTTPELERWVGQSGLTRTEVAMIQPTYGHPQDYEEPLDTAYEGFALGSNLASMIINTAFVSKNRRSKFGGITGVLSGTVSIVLSLNDRANFQTEDAILGSGALLLGIANLLLPEKKIDDPFGSLSHQSRKPDIGLSIMQDNARSLTPALSLRWQF